jgi:hypothetical protein
MPPGPGAQPARATSPRLKKLWPPDAPRTARSAAPAQNAHASAAARPHPSGQIRAAVASRSGPPPRWDSGRGGTAKRRYPPSLLPERLPALIRAPPSYTLPALWQAASATAPGFLLLALPTPACAAVRAAAVRIPAWRRIAARSCRCSKGAAGPATANGIGHLPASRGAFGAQPAHRRVDRPHPVLSHEHMPVVTSCASWRSKVARHARPITQRASAPRIFSLTLINQPPMITRPGCAAPGEQPPQLPAHPRAPSCHRAVRCARQLHDASTTRTFHSR